MNSSFHAGCARKIVEPYSELRKWESKRFASITAIFDRCICERINAAGENLYSINNTLIAYNLTSRICAHHQLPNINNPRKISNVGQWKLVPADGARNAFALVCGISRISIAYKRARRLAGAKFPNVRILWTFGNTLAQRSSARPVVQTVFYKYRCDLLDRINHSAWPEFRLT